MPPCGMPSPPTGPRLRRRPACVPSTGSRRRHSAGRTSRRAGRSGGVCPRRRRRTVRSRPSARRARGCASGIARQQHEWRAAEEAGSERATDPTEDRQEDHRDRERDRLAIERAWGGEKSSRSRCCGGQPCAGPRPVELYDALRCRAKGSTPSGDIVSTGSTHAPVSPAPEHHARGGARGAGETFESA